uniref:Ketoacyl_synth_N domain-containing protein n=1 Tax=Ascaris lumbricoides TaxID=6252 RepID=A0A0M3HQR1_ASCLU
MLEFSYTGGCTASSGEAIRSGFFAEASGVELSMMGTGHSLCFCQSLDALASYMIWQQSDKPRAVTSSFLGGPMACEHLL